MISSKAYGYLGVANFRFGQLADSTARYIDNCFRVYENSATNQLRSLVIGRIVKKDGTGQRRALGATFVAYEKAFSDAKARGGFRNLVNRNAS